MFEGHDEIVERIARHLKQPVPMDPTLERRVMEAIAALPAPRAGGPGALVALGRWLATPRRVPLPPLAGVAAAGIAALLLLRPGVRPEPRAEPAAFQFLLLAPRAQSVSLVG
ncbi:MAG TPA: hypothetical protein VNI61_09045, partial [Gemmatimonadales bacterium]|nr:hypothetical protein [Gemmatimonadales bacterium]